MPRIFLLFQVALIFVSFRVYGSDVYLSMTVNPNRLSTLHRVLSPMSEIILSESVKGVIINVPDYFRNNSTQPYDQTVVKELDEMFNLRYNGKVIFNQIGKDLGPISKILPTFRRLYNEGSPPDTIVISIDDDHLYSSEAIKELIEKKASYSSQGGVVTFGGNVLNHWIHAEGGDEQRLFPNWTSKLKMCFSDQKSFVCRVDVVEGWAGVAYELKDFSSLDLKLMEALATKTSKECRLSDDLVISFVLGLNNTPKYRLNSLKLKRGLNVEEAITRAEGLLKNHVLQHYVNEALPEEGKEKEKGKEKEADTGNQARRKKRAKTRVNKHDPNYQIDQIKKIWMRGLFGKAKRDGSPNLEVFEKNFRDTEVSLRKIRNLNVLEIQSIFFDDLKPRDSGDADADIREFLQGRALQVSVIDKLLHDLKAISSTHSGELGDTSSLASLRVKENVELELSDIFDKYGIEPNDDTFETVKGYLFNRLRSGVVSDVDGLRSGSGFSIAEMAELKSQGKSDSEFIENAKYKKCFSELRKAAYNEEEGKYYSHREILSRINGKEK
jgi:hypothetical protein